VVILAPIVSDYGLRGIIWAGMLAGVILLVMGFARLGRLIHYMPYPVTTGFTAGIAVVLATLSLNDFLGLGITHNDGSFTDKLMRLGEHLPQWHPAAAAVGVVTLALLFVLPRVFRALPAAVIAIPAGTLLALLLAHQGMEIATIGSQFSYLTPEGDTLPGIPPYPPVFHLPGGEGLFAFPSYEEWRALLFPALAIAILAAIESLLSATVADSMAGTRHDPDAELNAIGIGNILSALAAGIPATGAIARTATLINSGAKTPLASAMHAVLIMLSVLLLAALIRYVPMAALAALLIHTAWKMSHYPQFIRTIRIAPRSDVIVLLVCFLLTVFIDMVAGVGVGVICAAFLLIRHVSELTQVEVTGQGDTRCDVPLPEGTMLYRLRGPLFFATVERAFDRYQFAHDYTRCLLLDLRDVPFIDMTGLVALKSMLAMVAKDGRSICIICTSEEMTQRIARKIEDHPMRAHIRFYTAISDAVSGCSAA
jgi:SulP family sulfate permease